GVKGNAEKVSANWGNPQQVLKDKGVIDSGCSRHMTGNISFLFDFEEINEGYVAFRENPKGGKITDKDAASSLGEDCWDLRAFNSRNLIADATSSLGEDCWELNV
nr:ribonuclease H-like domain-containing protein [Tanacetum cinerariifolium]